MNLSCSLGFHDWIIGFVLKSVTLPIRGPFDTRTDDQRTWTHQIDVCAQCGKQRVTNHD